MRFWRIFRYRQQVIISTLYCSCLAGAVYYFLAPRYYESTAQLLIVEQKPDQLTAVGETDTTGNTMATHQKLVTSQVVISEAITRLAPEHRVDLEGIPPQDWTEAISDLLSANTTRRTNIIEVSFRSRSPETAAAVVRAVVESYLDFVKQTHQGAAGDNIVVLTNNHEKVQQELNETQIQLQQFRQRVGHLAVSSDDNMVEPMIQRAVRLNEAVLEAQEKRVSLQATLAAVQMSIQSGEDISQQLMSVDPELQRQILVSSMGLSPQDQQMLGEQQKRLLETRQTMQSLASDFGVNHPRMVALRDQIRSIEEFLGNYHLGADQRLEAIGQSVSSQAVVRILEQSLRQAAEQEQQLIASYEQARTEAARYSDALVQLAMLEREVERKEMHLDTLEEKIRDFDISQGQGPIKATVVKEPLPSDMPVTPQVRMVAALSLFGGLLFGGLLIYVQDTLDDRFASPEELSAQLGVPILAIVRQMEALVGEGLAAVHTFAQPHAVESEAFRTLRTSLSLSGSECDRILVSSSEPGDGKTTISANLAVAFAQAGKKTLIIDADLRRPGLSAMLNFKGRQGVADVLAGSAPAETVAPTLVQPTELENLDILPVGLRRPNPAELLSGNAFVELLAWADSLYDRVIVDCPPVLAVSDAQIVGQLVDGAVLVVRPDKNHRRSVIRAVESFQETSCHVLGVVANGVSHDSNGYGYGYGYGYDYGYGSGYGHEETEREDEPTEIQHFPESKPTTGIRPRRAA
jgi:capsular exopolysaccharide synthesis family protein